MVGKLCKICSPGKITRMREKNKSLEIQPRWDTSLKTPPGDGPTKSWIKAPEYIWQLQFSNFIRVFKLEIKCNFTVTLVWHIKIPMKYTGVCTCNVSKCGKVPWVWILFPKHCTHTHSSTFDPQQSGEDSGECLCSKSTLTAEVQQLWTHLSVCLPLQLHSNRV